MLSSSSSFACRRFSLNEIKDATNNFDMSNFLGKGGEGIVYLGRIAVGQDQEFTVAVKQLKPDSIEFENEIKIISKIQNPNVVSLIGYCNEFDYKILVYEYMQRGSLSDYVSKKKTSNWLSWKQRLKICLGAARGLQYLHTATDESPKGIIHRDMKPANILLDKDWVAKVSDFGMFKLSHAGQTNSTMFTDLKGTCGYYAPEYFRFFQITRKIDVYSFGVVLFEVLCRKKPWDRGDESYYIRDDEDLGLWAHQNVDAEINEEISGDSLKIFADIIGRSLRSIPGDRPTMDEVVRDLVKALRCQERTYPEGIHHKTPRLLAKAAVTPKKLPLNMLEEIGRDSQGGADINQINQLCNYHPGPAVPRDLMVMHKAEQKYVVGKITDEEHAKQRLFKGILNKLTPQNFEKLSEQVKQVNIDNAGTLSGLIAQIYDKALMEPHLCEMYASLCDHLADELPHFSDGYGKITFRKLLLDKCQDEFERRESNQDEANRAEKEGEVKQTEEEREEKRINARIRRLGNIRIIGELYKKSILSRKIIMRACIIKLLDEYQNPDEVDVEVLCELMSTLGKMIDHPKSKEEMDAYFEMMYRLSNNMKLSPRVRFMLKDLIDLRKNKWQEENVNDGPLHNTQPIHASPNQLAALEGFEARATTLAPLHVDSFREIPSWYTPNIYPLYSPIIFFNGPFSK